MTSIEGTVCKEALSGTDDNVMIRFKNGLSGECVTEYLNKAGNDWATGQTESWNKHFFKTCKDIRPNQGLWVKIETHNLLRDMLKICKIVARFSKLNTNKHNQYWQYSSGSEEKGIWTDPDLAWTMTTTPWLKMCRRCSRQAEKNELTRDEAEYCCD